MKQLQLATIRAFILFILSVFAIAATQLFGAEHSPHAGASVFIDEKAFGKALGGWHRKKPHTQVYKISGANYLTFKPVSTPTPDGGIFVSVRIDHVRGWLASDDHASLEVTVDSHGHIQSAKTNVAIQGRSVSSDLIKATNVAGQTAPGVDQAVKIGTDLVANLSEKLLREKIVEAGRVSYPAVIRHNYNHLFQSIRVAPPKEPSPQPNDSSPSEITPAPDRGDSPTNDPAEPQRKAPLEPEIQPFQPNRNPPIAPR